MLAFEVKDNTDAAGLMLENTEYFLNFGYKFYLIFALLSFI